MPIHLLLLINLNMINSSQHGYCFFVLVLTVLYFILRNVSWNTEALTIVSSFVATIQITFLFIFCTAFAPLLLSRCVPQKPETTEIHVKTERKTNRNISPTANTFMATPTKSLITFSHLFEALFSFSGCNPLHLWHAYYFVHHSTELPVFLSSHQREPLSLLCSLLSP